MSNQKPADDLVDQASMEALSERLNQRQTLVAKRRKAVTASSETSLQAIHRLFGDQVYDLFPDTLMESVDAMYKHGQEFADQYVVTEFESEQDKADSLALIRAYAEIAPGGGYTIRVDWATPPNVLAWKVTNRRKVNRDKTSGEGEGSTAA